jgi:hypothetical protein
MRKSNSEKGFIVVILLFIICVVVLIGGGWYFLQQSPNKFSQFETKGTPGDENTVSGSSFQEILTENCQTKKVSATVETTTIALSSLPLNFDKNLFVIKENDPLAITCSAQSKGQNFVNLEYNADYRMLIYDTNSVEPGHGGPSMFGSLGTLIKEQNNISIYAYLGAGEGPTFLGEVPLVVRGIKKVTLKNGGIVYLITNREMLDSADPLLVKYLQKYASPSADTPGQTQVNFIEAEKNLKSGLFADMTKLNTAQKEAIAFLESFLGGVTPK